MNEKFFDLKKEKQDRMINAALKIFALYGYRFASTDDMVKEAGISKGLLFHYFGSKVGLYAFVYDYSVRYMTMELKAAIDSKTTDFFKIMKQMEGAKLQILKNYPYMQSFLDKCETENVSEALLAIEEKKQSYNALYQLIYEQMDLSIFPDETTAAQIGNMLKYTIRDNMQDHFSNNSFNAEMLYEENMAYISLMESLVVQKNL